MFKRCGYKQTIHGSIAISNSKWNWFLMSPCYLNSCCIVCRRTLFSFLMAAWLQYRRRRNIRCGDPQIPKSLAPPTAWTARVIELILGLRVHWLIISGATIAIQTRDLNLTNGAEGTADDATLMQLLDSLLIPPMLWLSDCKTQYCSNSYCSLQVCCSIAIYLSNQTSNAN